MCINEMLIKLREDATLSKKELTEKLNIKYTTYANYEAGIREPNSDFLIKISKFYDVSIDYILGLTNIKSYSNQNLNIKEEELTMIKKYKKLDNHSKLIINSIIDLELQRNKPH